MTTSYRYDDATVKATGGWLKLSSELTKAVEWPAGRRDVLVTIAPGAGHGSKACFSPDRSWIEIDADVAGITEAKAGKIRPAWDWDAREDIAPLWGLLTHEAAHAAHTKWTAEAIARLRRHPSLMGAFEAAKLLEEARIENRLADRRWWDMRWLRASAATHLLRDVNPGSISDALIAARAYTLIAGRVQAGILDGAEARPILRHAMNAMNADYIPQLDAIIEKSLKVKDGDTSAMLELGGDWVNLFGDPDGGTAYEAAMVLLRDDGDPTTATTGNAPAVAVAAAGGQEDGEDGADGEGGNSGEGDIAGDGEDDRSSSGLARALARAIGQLADDLKKDAGRMAIGYTRRVVADFKPEWRKATPQQKAESASLARRLREYYLPERTNTRHDRPQPPGRLNVREAIRGEAQAWAGQIPDVTPWRSISRKMVQTPPLRVGIAVDVSGSMRSISSHSRELAYRLSMAFAALPDSRVRTISAGEGIEAWDVRPGMVPHYEYRHGEQNIHLAIRDLAERLQLYRRGSARLLVIISDGGFNSEEETETREQVVNLLRAGCHVLWLDFDKNAMVNESISLSSTHRRPGAVSLIPGIQYLLLTDPDVNGVVAATEKILVKIMTEGMRA